MYISDGMQIKIIQDFTYLDSLMFKDFEVRRALDCSACIKLLMVWKSKLSHNTDIFLAIVISMLCSNPSRDRLCLYIFYNFKKNHLESEELTNSLVTAFN